MPDDDEDDYDGVDGDGPDEPEEPECEAQREISRSRCLFGYQMVNYVLQATVFGECIVIDNFWLIEECEDASS